MFGDDLIDNVGYDESMETHVGVGAGAGLLTVRSGIGSVKQTSGISIAEQGNSIYVHWQAGLRICSGHVKGDTYEKIVPSNVV